MARRNITDYAISAALAVLVSAIVLSAAWPTLGPAWNMETQWGALAVAPAARLVWAMIAIAVTGLCLTSRSWRQLPLLIPFVIIAVVPPDKLDLSRDLLERRMSLVAEALAPVVMDEDVSDLASNADARSAFLEAMTGRLDVLAAAHAGVARYVGEPDGPDGSTIRREVERLDALDQASFDAPDGAERQTLLDKARQIDDRVGAGTSQACREEVEALRIAEVVARLMPAGQRGLRRAQARFDECSLRYAASLDLQKAERDNLRMQVTLFDARVAQAAADREALRSMAAADRALVAATEQRSRARRTAAVAGTVALAAVAATALLGGGWIIAAVMLVLTAAGVAFDRYAAPPDAVFPWQVVAAAVAASAVLMIARMVRLYSMNNAYLWTCVRREERLPLLWRTVRQSWPPLGVLLVATVLGAWGEARLLDPAYAGPEDAAIAECEDADRRLLATGKGNPNAADGCQDRSPERDSEEAVQRHLASLRADMEAGTAALSAEAMEGEDWAETEARRQFDAGVPIRLSEKEAPAEGEHVSPVFNKHSCWFLKLGCMATNLGKGFAQGSYVDVRADARGAMVRRLSAAGNAVDDGAGLAKAEVDAVTAAAIAEIKADLDRALWTGFRIGDVTRHVAVLVLTVALLKCLGYVYLRNVHHLAGFQDRLPEVVSRPGAAAKQPRIATACRDGDLTVHPSGPMRVARTAGVAGEPTVWAWPLANLSFLSRRLVPSLRVPDRANLVFDHYANEPGAPFTIDGREDSTLCAVHLEEGEVAAFAPEALIGFSNEIRIRSRWSFGAIDLLSARLRIPVAVGPGLIVLRLRGAPEAVDGAAGEDRFVRKASLVLWTPDVPYAVEGAEGIRATYGGNVSVRPRGGGFVIADRGLAGGGAVGLGLILALAVPV